MGKIRAISFCILVLFLGTVMNLHPQDAAGDAFGGEPADFIGLTLQQLLDRYGAPQSVYAVRGLEEWQDDVVFVYGAGDFYIFKDRVWQLGLKSAYKIKSGDSRQVALLVFGEDTEDNGDHIIQVLKGRNWPMKLRCNFDSAGKVTGLFIYRSDF
jgi:hypothetical protein